MKAYIITMKNEGIVARRICGMLLRLVKNKWKRLAETVEPCTYLRVWGWSLWVLAYDVVARSMSSAEACVAMVLMHTLFACLPTSVPSSLCSLCVHFCCQHTHAHAKKQPLHAHRGIFIIAASPCSCLAPSIVKNTTHDTKAPFSMASTPTPTSPDAWRASIRWPSRTQSADAEASRTTPSS